MINLEGQVRGATHVSCLIPEILTRRSNSSEIVSGAVAAMLRARPGVVRKLLS
jgi:hypothetical protein